MRRKRQQRLRVFPCIRSSFARSRAISLAGGSPTSSLFAFPVSPLFSPSMSVFSLAAFVVPLTMSAPTTTVVVRPTSAFADLVARAVGRQSLESRVWLGVCSASADT
jgi:hypothetical protein